MNKTTKLKRQPVACGTRRAVEIGTEERTRLIEACAYFRAGRHRPVTPDCFRDQDRREAAAAIDAVIRKKRKQ